MFSWQKFVRTFCYAAICFAGVLYLFIVLVDPYDSVPFSLPLEREPISTNQRFSYPSLARNKIFDSAIIGTSTARLLKPERLNALTGDRWVNLAMNSATAYEQMQVLKLFLRHHPNPKHIVIGIDDAWCNPTKEIQKFTFRPFPPWMYDDNPWNDLLYLFNDKAFENAVRLVEYWSGKRQAKYDRTGYRDFTEGFGPYIPELVAGRLYPKGKRIDAIQKDALQPASNESERILFASHDLLRNVISRSMSGVNLTILFMPLHAEYLYRGSTNYKACKRSIIESVSGANRAKVVDWMRIDTTTLTDRNYWDSLHFTALVAKKIEVDITKNFLN